MTDGTDPQTFQASIVTVLMHYPIDVARAVADPYSGIPGQQNWMPTPFEVRKACDAIQGPKLRAAQRARQIESQLAERRLLDGTQDDRRSFDEIKAEMAKIGIHFRTGRPAHVETVETFKAKYKLTDEEFDKLPDLPPRDDPYWQGQRKQKSGE